MDWMRQQIPGVQVSLHTNGQLAMDKMEILNRCGWVHPNDRVTVSFPSFDPVTFERMTGTRRMPDLAGSLSGSTHPGQDGCTHPRLLPGERGERGRWVHRHQMREFLARCREMGVRRVVIRRGWVHPSGWVHPRQYLAPSRGKRRLKPLLRTEGRIESVLQTELRAAGCRLVAAYRENPVYEYGGMEVTCWDFTQSTSRSLNLFSDGTISAEYLLIRSQKIYSSFTPSPSTWRGKAAIMEPR